MSLTSHAILSDTRAMWATLLIIILSTASTFLLCTSMASALDAPWYIDLNKPRLMPPAGLIRFAGFVLFALMVASAVLARLEAGSFEHASRALGLYFSQLAAMTFWCLFFFHYRDPMAAMGILVALWLLVFALIRAFAADSRPAALLQLPYLGWLTFAGYLNAFLIAGN